ncbi:dipeptidase [Roseococcus sp.]|uniref:dipeptidase n=1 Tax=Roseococcus sp. TaxID=2109646 RepID=UPI003BAB1D2C
MTLNWAGLFRGALPRDGETVTLEGEVFPLEDAPDGRLLLVAEAGCCIGCRPQPESTVEVLLDGSAPKSRSIRVSGIWRNLPEAEPWRWRIEAATVAARVTGGPWLNRRALLAAAPLLCAAPRAARAQTAAGAGRALVDAASPMDLHSHAGRVILRPSDPDRAFLPLAAPMRAGGMSLVSLAIVPDSPVIRVSGGFIQPYRQPAPGELWAHGQRAFARLHRLVAQEGLTIVTDKAGLARQMRPGAPPAILVESEGGDFMEGRIDRLEWAFREQKLRHLQLTHYHVNELGDIQTVSAVHNGLTDFGVEVVRACNRLGILVDVAHATLPMVRRAAEVTSKPINLSHTALTRQPRPFSRLIPAEHARVVAQTGGVVGIWPLVGDNPTPRRYAESIARMVDAVGVDHVGVGSDMLGLLGRSAFEDYAVAPDLAQALLEVGFDAEGTKKLMGGNFARVLAAVLPG